MSAASVPKIESEIVPETPETHSILIYFITHKSFTTFNLYWHSWAIKRTSLHLDTVISWHTSYQSLNCASYFCYDNFRMYLSMRQGSTSTLLLTYNKTLTFKQEHVDKISIHKVWQITKLTLLCSNWQHLVHLPHNYEVLLVPAIQSVSWLQ
jgi:hypothetical protein